MFHLGFIIRKPDEGKMYSSSSERQSGTLMVFIDAKCGLLLKERAHKDSIKEHVLKMPIGKRKKV